MRNRMKQFEAILHREVPVTRQMGIRLEEHDGRELIVRADFEPNINIHGTAFGGSLYSICAVTGWGLLYLKLEEAGLDAECYLWEAQIRYRKPVVGEIVSRCCLPLDGSYELFSEILQRKGKARMALSAEISADGGTAVHFDGTYAVIRNQT